MRVGLFATGALSAAVLSGALLHRSFADYDPSWIRPSQAPVRTVNSATGDVVVQTVQRQSSTAIDATPGTVTWAFPLIFTNAPTCYTSLKATNASYSFDAPLVTAISTTAVSVKVSAHPTALSIASLALPIALQLTTAPPAGTTITLTCVAPLP